MRFFERYLSFGILGLGVAVLLSLSIVSVSSASTVNLFPNADPSDLTGSATSSWVSYNTGVAQYVTLKLGDTDESKYLCGQSNTWGNSYGLDNPVDIGQGATSVQINALAKMRRASFFSTPDDKIALNAFIGGTLVGSTLYTAPYYSDTSGSTCTLTFTNTGNEWRSVSYNAPGGTRWTQAQINGMEMYLGRQTAGTSDLIKMFRAYATVTYDATPAVTTYLSRAYQDSNTTTPGTPLTANYDEPASLTTRGQKFRLRMSAYNTTGDAWSAGYGTVRLQYAKKTASTCSSQTGWTDVTTSSSNIRFYDNPSIANNASIAYQSGDTLIPLGVAQTYRESNDAPVVNSLPAGTTIASWDYSLQEDPAALGGTFCFKLAPISPLVEYTGFIAPAEVSTVPAPLGVDIVNSSNGSIANPVMSFGNLTVSGTCQQSNAVFGDANQKIRLINGTATNGWSVSVAPTGGATALWASGGGDQYDYNDSSGTPAGCSDGGDPDNKAGQLTVKPASSTLSPSSGCSNTGVTKGSNAAYVQDSVNAITLLSASAASQLYCAWDLTSVGLTQTIPAATPIGAYTLDLTMTAVAS